MADRSFPAAAISMQLGHTPSETEVLWNDYCAGHCARLITTFSNIVISMRLGCN